MSNSTIVYKDRLIRVNPENAYRLGYSSNGGRTWLRLHDKNANTGEFKELIDKGNELLAETTKGVFYSRDGGRVWFCRSRRK